MAAQINESAENIGARRLQTLMTSLLEEQMFNLPDGKTKKIRITKTKVQSTLKGIIEDEDLRKYIL